MHLCANQELSDSLHKNQQVVIEISRLIKYFRPNIPGIWKFFIVLFSRIVYCLTFHIILEKIHPYIPHHRIDNWLKPGYKLIQPILGPFQKTSYKRTKKGRRIQIMQQKDIHDMWCIKDDINCITLQLMK